MKPLLLLLASCAVACGAMHTITIEGYFNEADALYVWSENLTLPIHYVMTVEYDDQAVNSTSDNPNIGIYYTPTGWVTLAFDGMTGTEGDFLFSQQGTVVKIWKGQWGLYGISFGNSDEFEAYNLQFNAETAIYANLLCPNGYGVNPANTNLSQVFTLKDNEAMQTNGYGFMYTPLPVEANLLDHIVNYTVQ